MSLFGGWRNCGHTAMKEEIIHLNQQHPNPWSRGQWYEATTKNGQNVQIKRTTAAKTGVHYLHIRKRGLVSLKTPSGEILDRREEWIYFRANLSTFELKGL
jgi:hypothetical protein